MIVLAYEIFSSNVYHSERGGSVMTMLDLALISKVRQMLSPHSSVITLKGSSNSQTMYTCTQHTCVQYRI